MFKIAFFDVDGTLLKFAHKNLSKKTTYTLQQLQKNGILICMATGRSYAILPKFKDINFDILLTFNGSYVRNDTEIIRSTPLDQNDVKQISLNLKNLGRPMAVSNENTVVANGSDKDLTEYFRLGNEKLIIDESFDTVRNGVIYQIMCACKPEECKIILKGTNNTQIEAWWDRACDIVSKEGGKGVAVKDVLKHYGFSKDEAIAFGDGGNDIEMLKAVGTGVAMGNAKDYVKEIADEVCLSVEDDGVYHYCVNQGLIKKINSDH